MYRMHIVSTIDRNLWPIETYALFAPVHYFLPEVSISFNTLARNNCEMVSDN